MLQTLQAGLPEAELILTTFHYGEVVAQGDRQDLPYVADYKAISKNLWIRVVQMKSYLSQDPCILLRR